jgi:hypothetical protein
MYTPIVFIHRGYSDYLNYTITQAHLFNPESEIILISDIKYELNFIRHIQINDYQETIFDSVYKHLSTNDFNYELFCFKRWFILYKFFSKNNYKNFVYLDSDVLLYCNIEKVVNLCKNNNFTICNKVGPQTTFFSSIESLEKFCFYIYDSYNNNEKFKNITDFHKKHFNVGVNGGICDMTLFGMYQKEMNVKTFDLCNIVANETFDENINSSDGYELNKGIKNIKFINGEPHCKYIQNDKHIKFNSLHFQGDSKKLIKDFAILKKNHYKENIFSLLKRKFKKIFIF